MTKQNHVWVVEMKFGKSWKPTNSIFITKAEAKIEKLAWQKCNIDDLFRVMKYISNESMK